MSPGNEPERDCIDLVYSCAVKDARISVTLSGDVPAYRQVFDQLRLLIQTGELSAGDVLPGVRTIAAQLGVHHNTVAEAYRALAAEGLVEVSQGRRATVAGPRRPVALTRDANSALRLRLRGLVAELRSKGMAAETILKEMNAVLSEVG